MSEKTHEQFQEDLTAFANRWSLNRVKTSSLYFDRDYQRDDDGQFCLKTEKAVVRSHGKTSKVLIGEGHQYQTYEEAAEAVREKWSKYFNARRQSRSETVKQGERRRQKRYRERRKEGQEQFEHRQ